MDGCVAAGSLLTDSAAPEPSGSRAGMSTALCRAYTPGLGSVRGVPARPEPLLGEFALGLAALEPLAVRQHHRAECGGDQQRAGQFERPQVLGEDQRRQALDVAAGVGLRAGPVNPVADTLPMPAISRTPNPTPAIDRRNALSANGFHQRLRGVHADQHQHEQEQHHHRAGVDDHLHDAEEQRVLRDVEHRQRDHRGGQEHRRVHRLRRGDHADRPDHARRGRAPRTAPPRRSRCAGGRGSARWVARLGVTSRLAAHGA